VDGTDRPAAGRRPGSLRLLGGQVGRAQQALQANEVFCAHRTEPFGTIFVVTNLENGKKIRCSVQDRGPFARGRVLDFSLGAARQIGCDGLCRVTVRRAGYE
jgi:rare lipoprotein A